MEPWVIIGIGLIWAGLLYVAYDSLQQAKGAIILQKRAEKKADDYMERWEQAEADLAAAEVDLQAAGDRALESDRLAAEVVIATAPLLEKTDWTTGRWGGRFNELVEAEKKRNETVEEVRAKVMAIPVVGDLDRVETIAATATQAAESLPTAVGVPEGQTLSFGAEGGVQRVSRPSEVHHEINGYGGCSTCDREAEDNGPEADHPEWEQPTLPGMEDESQFRPLTEREIVAMPTVEFDARRGVRSEW